MKRDACFSAHGLTHDLLGIGFGILLVSVFGFLGIWWLGIVIMAIAVIFDAMISTTKTEGTHEAKMRMADHH